MGDETVNLFHADTGRRVPDLAVEIGHLDHIGVDDPDSPDASAGNILGSGAAESAGADDQNAGVYQAELS